jgi:hypothetical protein
VQIKDQDRIEKGSLSIPIEISWGADSGRAFTKKAVALAIGRFGAIIAVHHKLTPIQQITIRCTGKEDVLAQVVGQIREQYEGYVYGLSFLNPNANPWSAKIPSAAETEQSVSRQLLECETCKTRELVYLDGIQYEVFYANSSLSLHCKQCAVWTIWKLAQHEDAVEPNARAGGADLSPDAQSAAVPRTHDERKRFRVRLKKFKACIRRPGFLEEVVRVEDVTRDGFRFVSHKLYEKGSCVQVAIPFMAEAPNIFVPAQIIRFRDLPRNKGTEYGVAYMEAPVDPPTDS